MTSLRAVLLVVAALFVIATPVANARAAAPHPGLSYDLGSPPPDPDLNALDLYTPDGVGAADSRPVVVYVHGGGWRGGDKANQIQSKVDLFTGAGYLFASVNYGSHRRT